MKSNFVLKNYIHLLLIITIGFFNPLFSVAGEVGQPPIIKDYSSFNQRKTIQVITTKSKITDLSITSTNFADKEEFSGCEFAKLESGNLVQNQTVVNLNQPASCFELTISDESTASLQKIRVAMQPSSVSVVVVERWPVQTITFLKFGSTPSLPIQSVPMQFFGFVIFDPAVYKFKKAVQKINNNFLLPITVNLELMMIMRC